ncbi:MAG: MDR/zinc-dependent alcohol dehydrogenase-like family protein [Anaerolineae bacterium]
MKALVYSGEEAYLDAHYPQPVAGCGEALIRVTLAGICNTDLEIIRGYMGFRGVLGHEFVGVVEEAPDRAWLGRRVIGEINCACGVCPTCLAGRRSHCPYRTTVGIDRRDGVLAEYVALPQANLHAVPQCVNDRQAVFVEPLAAALEILEQAHLRPSERAIVLGDGKLGLLVAQVLALTGSDLLVLGRHRQKLEGLARRGIATALAAEAEAAPADLVVDCTGYPDGCKLARSLVRPGGRLVLKSTFCGENCVSLTGVVVDEITLIGSRCGPFAPALRLLERGLVEVENLIAATYPLDRAEEALAHAAAPGTLKVLVQHG